jgi:hypothetical protein
MAQIKEQKVLIRLTKLLKSNDKSSAILMPASIRETLEQFVAELLNDATILVEVADDGDED